MISKIKICHIITKLELGGAQKNTLYTVSNLNKEEFEAFLISGEKGILDGEANKKLNAKFISLHWMRRKINPLFDMIALIQLIIILKKLNPDIIHTHSSKAGILGRWAGYLSGVRIRIHSIHGFGFYPQQFFLIKWIFIHLEKITGLITTHFIAVSKNNIEYGSKLKILKKDNVSLIRSGIEIERFTNVRVDRDKKKKELGLPLNKKIIGMIVPFKPQKAPLDFVRIARLLKNEMPNTHFVLVGDGELRKKIEKEIKKSNLIESFSLLGWRYDIEEIYQILNVLVLTSIYEGLPQVIPQAFSSEVPVVATSVDGNAEIINDGQNGFLFKPHDFNDAKEKIIALLRNSELSKSFAEKNKKMLDEFEINSMVKKQEKLYKQLFS
ncbi:MAG: glycosyltransferase family 4 protein [Acidobacteriota bacterium]